MKKIFNNGPIWVRFDISQGQPESMLDIKVADQMGTQYPGGVIHLCNMFGMTRTEQPSITLRELLERIHKCK